MPETATFGFEYETPQTKPGITLTGNQDGSSPILAEQVDTALANIDARVSTNEGDVAALQAVTPSDTGWIALSVTPATGFDTVEALYRHWGPIIGLRIVMQRTGSPINATNDGNIVGDPALCTIDTINARPSQQQNILYQSNVTSGSISLFTSGIITITDAHTNSTINTDAFIRISHNYFGTVFN